MNIVVGDVSKDLGDFARAYDARAVAWTPDHCSTTAYVSLGDVDISTFLRILLSSDHIIYHDHLRPWSDTELKHLTDNVIYLLGLNGWGTRISRFPFESFVLEENRLYRKHFDSDTKDLLITQKICQYDQENFIGLTNHRRSFAPQIWVAGCSIAYGLGVEQHERYASIIGNYFNLSMTNIAWPGSSIDFAADQIMRSDLRAGDLLIWGITGPQRYSWFENGLMQNIIPKYIDKMSTSSAQKKLLNLMAMDDSRVYLAQRHIEQVQNICDKMHCDLVMMYHEHLGPTATVEPMKNFLRQNLGFIDINQTVLDRYGAASVDSRHRIDVGTDGLHPGPRTHAVWADLLCDFVQRRQCRIVTS